MKTSSTVDFRIAESSQVSISIMDGKGRTVHEVMNEFLIAGSHSVTLNLKGLAEGIYFLLIHSAGENKMIKLSVAN